MADPTSANVCRDCFYPLRKGRGPHGRTTLAGGQSMARGGLVTQCTIADPLPVAVAGRVLRRPLLSNEIIASPVHITQRIHPDLAAIHI